MHYLLKQKAFSFGDDFVIKNESGEEIFYVDGKAFTLAEKLIFQDMSGNELAYIKQTILSIGTNYEIYRNGRLLATMHKSMLDFLRESFSITGSAGDIAVQGNLAHNEYTFTRGDRNVATVSKHWMAMTDTYDVDIVDGEDDILILACAVVIDMVCHPDHKNK
jgi:uncharacterized protein YxjI